MDDVIKYFKWAMLFPIIVTLFVAIVIIIHIYNGGYNIICGSNYINMKKEFVWPTPNFKNISSTFGRRQSPTAGASSYHKGVDVLAYQGSEVVSIADGQVIFAGWDASGGYMIKIKHENGIQSAYCHLSEEMYVTKNESVKKGQLIATVGPKYVSNGKLNGATTGVHLHFAIYKNGKAVDPLGFY